MWRTGAVKIQEKRLIITVLKSTQQIARESLGHYAEDIVATSPGPRLHIVCASKLYQRKGFVVKELESNSGWWSPTYKVLGF